MGESQENISQTHFSPKSKEKIIFFIKKTNKSYFLGPLRCFALFYNMIIITVMLFFVITIIHDVIVIIIFLLLCTVKHAFFKVDNTFSFCFDFKHLKIDKVFYFVLR